MRKIIHVDMDAFYASVEQRDHPHLRGKPVAVGGAGNRGVVAAASYEARAFGVFSAMASKVALRKCPDLLFVPPRFEVYKEVSRQIRHIFLSYTDLVEPLSLDEAYLDVTENKVGLRSATLIARDIKIRIKEATGLTASAGVSVNKFLAKVASGLNKPDGLTVIPPEQAESFVQSLPVGKFHGIGQVTAARMKALGIHTGLDLKQLSEADLYAHFGKNGRYFYQISRGFDERAVQPNRVRKSLGAEETYEQDLVTEEQMRLKLEDLAEEVAQGLARLQIKGRTLTLKIKYHDFTLTTRSKTTSLSLQTSRELSELAADLLQKPSFPAKPVRLLGLSVSNLVLTGPTLGPSQLSIEF